MRFLLSLTLALLSLSSFEGHAFLGMNGGAFLQSSKPWWTKRFNATTGGTPRYTQASAVAADSSGNIYVAGSVQGWLDGNVQLGIGDFFVTKYDSSGVKQWTQQLGTDSATVNASGVATDASGNIYVAGTTNGGLDGNAIMGGQDFFVTKYSSSGVKQWTRQLGVATKYVYAKAVATDSSGGVYVAGFTDGGLDGNTAVGTFDFFVTKYDSSGVKQWTRQLGVASKYVYGNAVAADSSGGVYVAGTTNGGLDGNTIVGTQDFFVTKYDSSGVKQWTRQLGVATKLTIGKGVATDSSGNVFVAGDTRGGLDGNTLTGSSDFFVTKYDSTGAKQWTRQLGVASKFTYGEGVAADSSGNVYVAGYTEGGLDGNSLTGTQDVISTKYNSAGVKQWTRQLGVASQQTQGAGGAVDSSGNLYVAGTTSGGLDGNTLTGLNDLFVIKYDTAGAKQWTRQLGTTGKSTFGSGVAADSSGNIYVVGTTNGGMDGNTQTGLEDFFVSKYNSSGVKQWTRQLGAASSDTSGKHVATDSAGNVFVAGRTSGALDGNTLTGTWDLFVTKYNSSGVKQWTRQLGAAAHFTSAEGVATDAAGNVFIGGRTDGGLDGNTLTGTWDVFVIKYDSAGVKQWSRQLGVALSVTRGWSLATDASGNVFVAGDTDGGLDGNTLTGGQDIFVTKYDTTGAKQWTRQLGEASSYPWGTVVATDSSGNIFIAATADAGMDGNVLIGDFDSFVTKYDTTGTKQWTRQWGAAGGDVEVFGIAADSQGNTYITGFTDRGLDGLTLTGSYDIYITKYNSAGTRQWTRQLGTPSQYAAGYGVCADQKGNIYITGEVIKGSLDGQTFINERDAFLIKYGGN